MDCKLNLRSLRTLLAPAIICLSATAGAGQAAIKAGGTLDINSAKVCGSQLILIRDGRNEDLLSAGVFSKRDNGGRLRYTSDEMQPIVDEDHSHESTAAHA